MVAGEVTLATRPRTRASPPGEMTRGRYRGCFWLGAGARRAAALIAPSGRLAALAALAALAGLLAHEHAYVQAGQSVPLA